MKSEKKAEERLLTSTISPDRSKVSRSSALFLQHVYVYNVLNLSVSPISAFFFEEPYRILSTNKCLRDGRVMKIFLTWESSLAPSGTST